MLQRNDLHCWIGLPQADGRLRPECHDHKCDDIPTKDFTPDEGLFSTVAMPPPEPGDGFPESAARSLQLSIVKGGQLG
ncbi:MAG: hypothetical protein R3B91_21230 [Planctomycetaceae bacterium]